MPQPPFSEPGQNVFDYVTRLRACCSQLVRSPRNRLVAPTNHTEVGKTRSFGVQLTDICTDRRRANAAYRIDVLHSRHRERRRSSDGRGNGYTINRCRAL